MIKSCNQGLREGKRVDSTNLTFGNQSCLIVDKGGVQLEGNVGDVLKFAECSEVRFVVYCKEWWK